MKITDRVVASLAFFAMLALPLAASAQYLQDFDGLSGSPDGVILTGQDGYYLPNPSGDTDFKVYTYAGNTLGIVQNPEGGSQFIAGTGPGGGVYARAQRNLTFGFGVWDIYYDFCAIYTGAPPSSDNVGSFSMRQAANTVHINLFTWMDINNPVAIKSTYIYYDANNNQSPIPGNPPGPEWSNLSVNHWYRGRTTVDFDQNLIIEVGIRDLSGGTEAVYNPTGWYLYGGANPVNLPDGIRWFGGGGNPGNTCAFDNAVIQPAVAPPVGACCINGACTITTEQDCGGQWLGPDYPTCDPNPCPPVPVQHTTWGAIKNQYH